MRTAPCTRPSTRSGTVASQRLAAFAVDSYDQTPAVVRVRAVRHHRVVFHPARRDGGPDVPAPRGALAQGPRIVVRAARGPGGASSCLPRSASRWRMTPVGEHVTHIHRWVPALVLPFRFIAAPQVVPEFLRTLVFARPRGDDQFADCTFSPSLDMSR